MHYTFNFLEERKYTGPVLLYIMKNSEGNTNEKKRSVYSLISLCFIVCKLVHSLQKICHYTRIEPIGQNGKPLYLKLSLLTLSVPRI